MKPRPQVDVRFHDSEVVAVVTGANHGIGAATALALATVGARVLATYHPIEPGETPGLPDEYVRQRARTADWVVEAIRDQGGRAVSVAADLTDEASPAAILDHAEAELGPVQVLVNNASGWLSDTFTPRETDRYGHPLGHVSAATFDRQFGVDARGGALLIAEFARRHIERQADWGRVIGLTSGGPLGFPEEVSYGAAKAALENYTMSAARELADYGITANVVMPPVTDTGWVTDDVRAFVERSSEHFHVAGPEEVAEVVLWLCSDAAGLVTANRIVLR